MISVMLTVPSGDIPATLCGPGLPMFEQPLAASSSARANRRAVAERGIVIIVGLSYPGGSRNQQGVVSLALCVIWRVTRRTNQSRVLHEFIIGRSGPMIGHATTGEEQHGA